MNYSLTIKACYVGTFVQAIIINLAAILFTSLAYQFSLSYTQLGILVFINFGTQVSVALIFGNIVDRYGFRRFIVGAHLGAIVGIGIFAATPLLPFEPYLVLIIGTVIYSAAGGFMELLHSPILNAVPSEEKESAMSIMHGFYCFGQLFVVIGTTVFLFIFGRDAWPIVALLWLTIPLIAAVLFMISPIAEAVPVDKQSSAKAALHQPLFIVLVLIILFSGASEITFSQWASAFLERAMGIPKIIGDFAGVGMFALMMGLSRISYGILKQKGTAWLPAQSKLMLAGSALAAVCYIAMAVSYNPVIGLIACALCGLGVGLLWPGTLSLAVDSYPRAGTWMFAIMAAAGNIGASSGPVILGVIADLGNLRYGFFVTVIFPLGAVLCLMLYHRLKPKAAIG